MTRNSTTASTTQPITETAAHLFDNWFNPIEAGMRQRVREFLERTLLRISYCVNCDVRMNAYKFIPRGS
jgi:hypothetical protein